MNDFHKGAPREIDRADVLAELSHRFEEANPNNELAELDILRFREPDDEVGICRREDHDGGYTIWQRFEDEHGKRYWGCAYSTASGNRIPGPVSVNVLARLPYAGCAPGTPAAVRLLAEVEHTNEFPPEAATRDLCTLDGCAAAPVCSSGAGVWHYRTENCGRVFRSDGTEPPKDVQVVTDGHHYLPYLIRFQGGWCWSQEKDGLVGAGRSPGATEWESATAHSKNTELREVSL